MLLHQTIKVLQDVQKFILGTSDYSFIQHPSSIYPIDLAFTLDCERFYYSQKDDDGIPVKHYSSVGTHYNPTRVAAYGLAHYNRYLLTNTKDSKNFFFKCADWFLSNKQALYYYNFDWHTLKAPWISCMSQGEAASILVRGYLVSSNKNYLEHAELSLEPFFLSIKEGGVASTLSDGSLFLEEYPSKNPPHVLNGFLYALIGLYEFARVSGSVKHFDLFRTLVESLQQNISIWDIGKWSLYEDPKISVMENWCTPSYHNLQITQLLWLNEKTPSEYIGKMISHWIKGSDSLNIRLRALVHKSVFRFVHKAQR